MKQRRLFAWSLASLGVLVAVAVWPGLGGVGQGNVLAATPPPSPSTGAVGVEGTIASPAPTQPASIGQPGNGEGFTTAPVTVSGTCPKDTLVKVFSNGIFVGSVLCENGSYTLQVQLFSGRNDLIARVFDNLDQQGPDSNAIAVTFTDAQYAQFSAHVLLTSQYARRAADPGTEMQWPVIVSGGLGPFAISIDWGDGSAPELHSEPFANTFTYTHTYSTAGVYRVTFKVADVNGTQSYLQVVAVATGSITQKPANQGSGGTVTVVKTKILWIPTIILFAVAVATFWLGRRYELAALRKRLEENI